MVELPLAGDGVRHVLEAWSRGGRGPVVALTGAGVSAESGIPTFRGAGGYWTRGSANYRPEELATLAMFRRRPELIWTFYLERIARCCGARPNPGHLALVRLEERLGEDFTLVTQNVDGLHRRAGSSVARTFQIHGDLARVRCADACGAPIRGVPEELVTIERGEGERLDARVIELLTCADCGGWLRPHVLWFDECYDEEHFRFESSLGAVEAASLLLVVGTSGATTLPALIVQQACERAIPILVVGPEPTPFSGLAQRSPLGGFAQGAAGVWLPKIVDAMLER